MVNRFETMRVVKRVAPFMLLGPITGPLVAGVVLNLKDRHFVLAGMYAVLTVLLTLASPILAAAMMAQIR